MELAGTAQWADGSYSDVTVWSEGARLSGELEELAARAEELAHVADGRPEARRAERLHERLAARRFVISVAGEFKRGKSTLINALIGEDVLPTGVLPLTAIATELRFGDPGATVEHVDGRRVAIDPGDISDFVTEGCNRRMSGASPGSRSRDVGRCWRPG